MSDKDQWQKEQQQKAHDLAERPAFTGTWDIPIQRPENIVKYFNEQYRIYPVVIPYRHPHLNTDSIE